MGLWCCSCLLLDNTGMLCRAMCKPDLSFFFPSSAGHVELSEGHWLGLRERKQCNRSQCWSLSYLLCNLLIFLDLLEIFFFKHIFHLMIDCAAHTKLDYIGWITSSSWWEAQATWSHYVPWLGFWSLPRPSSKLKLFFERQILFCKRGHRFSQNSRSVGYDSLILAC